MKFKYAFLTITLFLSSTSQAEWYQQENINWWMIVFARLSCEQANQAAPGFTPMNLIEKKQCEYIADDSSENDIAIIGCQEVDVIFTTTKESCENYLSALKETMEKQQ